MVARAKRLGQFFLRFRLPLILGFNVLLTFVGYFIALGLRFDFDVDEIFSPARLWIPALLLITTRTWSYIHYNLNHGYWRYSSTHDLVRIVKAHAAASILFVALVLVLRLEGFPRSVIFFEFALSLLLSGGSRLAVRLLSERLLGETMSEARGAMREVIVIGAGDSGHLVVKNMLSHRRLSYVPVAVLDDSERIHGGAVFGVPVRGTLANLENVIASLPNVAAVIIAIPSLSRQREEEITEICKRIGIAVKKLQAFEDIACADAIETPEGVTIESVLEKERKIEHEAEIRDAIAGKRVLVTGAGGSIGSEIVRQLLNFNPSLLVVFDNSEFNLFQLRRELVDNDQMQNVKFVLGSICDERRMHSVFLEHRPHFVFHAAAYKHVPLMEENCYQAFRNNVLGTRSVLECSVKAGVSRFVLISTDKAVLPSSVMGASKRVAELLVRRYAAESNGKGLNAAVVRFGNVINSSGSVIPIFKQQILSGGPVTVTHPEMERFFMSIREAVRLVLMAGVLGARGEVFVLDMGKPIKVVEVAKKMLALYGRRDIEIVFTGIRPGEKLTEELTSGYETLGSTQFEKVNRVSGDASGHTPEKIAEWVAEMERTIGSFAEREIGNNLLALFSTASDVEKIKISRTTHEPAISSGQEAQLAHAPRRDA